MTNKRVVVTGPTSGIGKEIAIEVAKLGADLVLACRNLELGRSTADEIARLTGSKNCEVMHIDTSSWESIHEFAKQYREKYQRLDVLINNAGINSSKRKLSVDGIELTFGTNVMGYQILTLDMLDLLRASAPSRIVNVASTFASNLDLADIQFERRSYAGVKAYAQSKACNRMLTWAVARRLEGTGVTANAMAPGLVASTGLYRESPAPLRVLLRFLGSFVGRTLPQAADTAVWLASSPEVEGVSGKFFELRKELPCQFRNSEAEEKLWSICEGMTRAK
jgi:NAD(P)-dependent dehydrogenase (short-subunit alcohol dehydrogenase family)